MCGIAGIALEGLADPEGTLRAMAALLSHRGPDDAGTWADRGDGIGFAHTRLSIVDLSPAGHQPMTSGSGRYVITFNGEIYNHPELRRTLSEQSGAPVWHGHSDTETLLAAFDAWGIAETLKRCNGMFALGVWDTERQELTLARDRIGEKPLYLGWVGHRFAFASELRAMEALPAWDAHVDPWVARRFLVSGYVRGMASIVSGIWRMPPAHRLVLERQALSRPLSEAELRARMHPYWSLLELSQAQPIADTEEAVDVLDALLKRSVALRMVADVPVGAFISGGVDSTLVVSLMQVLSQRPVRTYSIGFAEAGYDEAPHARRIAGLLGTDHTECYVSANEALAALADIPSVYDEPFADASQIPTLLVSRLARRHVTVALSGDGGDELFAGYGRYAAILRLWRVLSAVPAGSRAVAAPLLQTGAWMADAMHSIGAGSSLNIAERMQRLASRLRLPDVDAMRRSFIDAAGATALLSRGPRPEHESVPLPDTADPLRRLMLGDQLDYLPDDILVKLDRSAMSVGLETRVPLLDPELLAFSWRLPRVLLQDAQGGKSLLRRVLYRYVPRTLVDRPKQGFAPPLGDWLRGALKDWAETLLASDGLSDCPVLDASRVRRLWSVHQSGRRDASQALWNVLMLLAWRERAGAHF